MGIDIRFAADDREHLAAFDLRADVFFGEEILHGTEGQPLTDIFDALPSSRTIVAMDGDTVVGTVRITSGGHDQSPVDGWFNPRAVLPSGARIGIGSMLCVAAEHRHGTIGYRLVGFATEVLRARDLTHAVAPIRPAAELLFQRQGWVRVAEPFGHQLEQVPVVPMFLDLNAASAANRSTPRPFATTP